LVVTLSVVVATRNYESEFLNWAKKHSKTYSSIEYKDRLSKWKRNLFYIEASNSKNLSYTLGLNQFGDLSSTEFRSLFLSGLKLNQSQFIEMSRGKLLDPKAHSKRQSTWDWRQKNAVTGVKNQEQCGGCWSFSTTGSTEGCNSINHGTLTSLSEQNLIDCSSSYGNQGCNGGLMTNAMDYIIKNGGVDTESSYPYQAKDGTCTFKSSNVGGTLTSYSNVASGDESALATAGKQGPVSVAIDASQNSFQFYTSGIYYEPACSSSNLDHGVLMVGAGTESDGNYWIVKNSWGTSWGQQGYIWMAKDRSNNCGIATAATLPIC